MRYWLRILPDGRTNFWRCLLRAGSVSYGRCLGEKAINGNTLRGRAWGRGFAGTRQPAHSCDIVRASQWLIGSLQREYCCGSRTTGDAAILGNQHCPLSISESERGRPLHHWRTGMAGAHTELRGEFNWPGLAVRCELWCLSPWFKKSRRSGGTSGGTNFRRILRKWVFKRIAGYHSVDASPQT